MEARRLFEKAVELDPNFAHVYAMLAWLHWFEFSNAWTYNPEASLD